MCLKFPNEYVLYFITKIVPQAVVQLSPRRKENILDSQRMHASNSSPSNENSEMLHPGKLIVVLTWSRYK